MLHDPHKHVSANGQGYIYVPETRDILEDDGSFIELVRANLATASTNSASNQSEIDLWAEAILRGDSNPLEPGASNPILEELRHRQAQAGVVLDVAKVGVDSITPDPVGELAALYFFYKIVKKWGSADALEAALRFSRADEACELDAKTTPRFTNQFPAHEVGVPIQTFTPAQVTGNFSRRVNYVVTENGQLIMGRQDKGVGGGHIDLAGGAPVQAAGEALFVDGKLRYLDNSSGHYLPTGPHAQAAAVKAFEDAGISANGLYIEKIWNGSAWVPK